MAAFGGGGGHLRTPAPPLRTPAPPHPGTFDTVEKVVITLNGEPHDLPGPLTVTELLAHLRIDPRRVAVELNLVVLKRATFDTALVGDADQVEIVNFVGGG